MKIPEVLLIEIDRAPGSLAKVLEVVGKAGLMVDNLATVHRTQNKTTWELTLEMDEDSGERLFAQINALPNAKLVGRSDRVLTRHEGGKIQIISKVPLTSLQVLRDIYTPGVARVCLAIQKDKTLVRKYTNLKNTVAIVTNGSAILGLGNIGPVAGLPVMEGKAALFHALIGISAIPILIDSKNPQKIVDIVTAIAPSFGAIQLEDIAAPECFEIEQRLVMQLDIPVLHDDQHGTAVVALAALLNAAKMAKKNLKQNVIGQIGLGAAGIGIARLLLKYGVKKLIGADIHEDAMQRLESVGGSRATLAQVMEQANIVVATTGVKDLIKPEMVRKNQLILALSNPDPEIEPAVALERGASFAADGKSINNVLGFPGLFRGALDAAVNSFTAEMLFAAGEKLAALAPDGQLVPSPLDLEVHTKVAEAVAIAATKK